MDHFEAYLLERINYFTKRCLDSKNRKSDYLIFELELLDEMVETLSVYRTKYKIDGINFLEEL